MLTMIRLGFILHVNKLDWDKLHVCGFYNFFFINYTGLRYRGLPDFKIAPHIVNLFVTLGCQITLTLPVQCCMLTLNTCSTRVKCYALTSFFLLPCACYE